tara:strand:+ start:189 stop:566 length:378 start_codon:yes stop_codon:yes gene_type:complete
MKERIYEAVIKSKEDIILDEIFRQAYGQGYTWDSANNTLALRKGVGTIEDGPTIPKVKIPTGKVANKIHKIAEVPVAIMPTSVKPADLGFDADEIEEKPDSSALRRASAKAKAAAYIAGEVLKYN